jgi:hypothetical protein
MPERTNLHRFPVPSSIQKRKNVPPRIVQTLHAMERENQKLEELLDLARSMNKTTSKTHTKYVHILVRVTDIATFPESSVFF